MHLNLNNSLTVDDVSRETETLFRAYYDMLHEWNKSMSLMKLCPYDEFVKRHINDGMALSKHLPKGGEKIIDLGSGAGVPGIILLILGYNVQMVDSCSKKTIFLNAAIKKFNLNGQVLCNRINNLSCGNIKYITARALAPLNELIHHVYEISNEAECYFIKGMRIDEEIAYAQGNWQFDHEIHEKADRMGCIVKITNIEKKASYGI